MREGGRMSWKTPRWLWMLEGMLLLGALLVLAYKAMIWVAPMPKVTIPVKQARQKFAAAPTIMDYFRQFPDRYIRVENELWVWRNKSAVHSFTLRNLATVPYNAIEVRFSYESQTGEVLLTREVEIPGVLESQGTMKINNIEIQGVPAAAKIAIVEVARARMVR
jgi:hypothetical protein